MIKYLKYFKAAAALFLAAAAVSSAELCVYAETSQKLYDNAELFSDAESEDITSQLENLCDYTGWDTVIYTNYNGVESYDMEDYCNNYYDEQGFGCGDDASGVLLTIDMSSRQMYILTKGEAMEYFTDERVDDILDEVQYYLSDSEYYSAAETFVNYTEEYYLDGIPENGNYENVFIGGTDTGITLEKLLKCGALALIIALVASIAAVLLLKRRYNRLANPKSYDLSSNSHLNLTQAENIFLRKNVTVTRIYDDSDNHGGGGGGHSHSSGGSSHGGGGRGF